MVEISGSVMSASEGALKSWRRMALVMTCRARACTSSGRLELHAEGPAVLGRLGLVPLLSTPCREALMGTRLGKGEAVLNLGLHHCRAVTGSAGKALRTRLEPSPLARMYRWGL